MSQYLKGGYAQPRFRKNLLASAISLGVMAATGLAQAAIELEEVVVTASPGKAVSKMDSSLSVSSVSAEQAEDFVARSTTEIFRSIPGVRSESSAGESNTNISIRGIPVASGGGKFLQLQEDGLPVLQYGDIIVGNADNYMSYDWTISRIEAVKGGTAATMSSNSPAGVINFVSKTGKEEGGSIGYTAGLDYDSDRVDFEYGTPVGDGWSYHVGGYFRQGKGVRETDFNGNEGGQIKLSLSKDFDKGYARVYAKVLDDKTATFLPMPMLASGKSINGFDALTGTNIPAELQNTQTGNFGTGLRSSDISDGSHVKSKVIGGEFEIELSDDLTLREKIRLAQNSGSFYGAFTAALGSATDPASISSAFTGQGIDGLAYASGANAGTLLTADELANLNGNGLIQNIRTFDNDIKSLDNFANDISLTKSFDNFDITVGYYTASQDIDIDWYWQTYLADVSNDVRLLNAYSGSTQVTSGGLVAYGAPDWGFCCYRSTALETDLDAFYIAGSFNVTEDLSVTASVRHDSGEGNGHYAVGSQASVDFNGDGTLSLAEQNAQTISSAAIAAGRYKYDWSYNSFALGANYLLTEQSAVFANYSRGGRANADRLGAGSNIVNGAVVSDAIENRVTQYEAGYKYENDVVGIFGTVFYVETDDVNAEVSDIVSRLREYKSKGVELEVTGNVGPVSLLGNVTYTDAEITDANDETLIGKKPRRQADFVYSLSSVYAADRYSAGLSMVGTTGSYAQDANNYKLKGYQYFNAFMAYQLTENFSARLAVNNLFDQIGITEAENDAATTINGVDYVRARSIAGRSTSLSVKYEF